MQYWMKFFQMNSKQTNDDHTKFVIYYVIKQHPIKTATNKEEPTTSSQIGLITGRVGASQQNNGRMACRFNGSFRCDEFPQTVCRENDELTAS